MSAAPGPAIGTPAGQSLIVSSGEIRLYRLYDIGYEIDLARAFDLLHGNAPERVKPARGEAQAIQIANPP